MSDQKKIKSVEVSPDLFEEGEVCMVLKSELADPDFGATFFFPRTEWKFKAEKVQWTYSMGNAREYVLEHGFHRHQTREAYLSLSSMIKWEIDSKHVPGIKVEHTSKMHFKAAKYFMDTEGPDFPELHVQFHNRLYAECFEVKGHFFPDYVVRCWDSIVDAKAKSKRDAFRVLMEGLSVDCHKLLSCLLLRFKGMNKKSLCCTHLADIPGWFQYLWNTDLSTLKRSLSVLVDKGALEEHTCYLDEYGDLVEVSGIEENEDGLFDDNGNPLTPDSLVTHYSVTDLLMRFL